MSSGTQSHRLWLCGLLSHAAYESHVGIASCSKYMPGTLQPLQQGAKLCIRCSRSQGNAKFLFPCIATSISYTAKAFETSLHTCVHATKNCLTAWRSQLSVYALQGTASVNHSMAAIGACVRRHAFVGPILYFASAWQLRKRVSQ